jgi:hypothetical protein
MYRVVNLWKMIKIEAQARTAKMESMSIIK